VLCFLLIHNDLFLLGGAQACSECRYSVCSRVIWCLVCPHVVGNDHPVLILWDDACKIAVALALVKVVGLQDCEYPLNFILKVVNGFRRDDTCNLCDGALFGGEDLVCSVLRFARHGAFAFGGLLLAVA